MLKKLCALPDFYTVFCHPADPVKQNQFALHTKFQFLLTAVNIVPAIYLFSLRKGQNAQSYSGNLDSACTLNIQFIFWIR